MLSPLSDHVVVALVRSDRLLAHLVHCLTDLGEDSLAEVDLSLPSMLIEDIAPNRFRIEEIQAAFKAVSATRHQLSLRKLYTMNFAGDVFDRHYRFHGSCIRPYKRGDQRARWLISKVHPFTFAGWVLANRLGSGDLNCASASRIARTVNEHLLAGSESEELLADPHIHLGGVAQASYLIVALLFAPSLPVELFSGATERKLPIPPELTLLRSGKIRFSHILALLRLGFRVLGGAGAAYGGEWPSIRRDFALCFAHPVLAEKIGTTALRRHGAEKDGVSHLFGDLRKEARDLIDGGKYCAALLMILVRIHRILQATKDPRYHAVALIFIHCLNIIRAVVTMGSDFGLSHFVMYYASPFRSLHALPGMPPSIRRHNLRDRAVAIFGSGTRIANFRVTPNIIASGERNLAQTIRSLDQGLSDIGCLELTTTAQDDRCLPMAQMLRDHWHHPDPLRPTYQFTLHFLRTHEAPLDPLPALPGNHRIRKSVRRQTLRLDRWLNAHHSRARPVEMFTVNWLQRRCGPGNPDSGSHGQRIDLTKLVCGLDVAGAESHFAMEVFSPAFLFLRRDHPGGRRDTVPHLPETAERRRLPAHIHAGEDFSHLASGMRAVDEAVTFCEYRRGDRIGHGLAMGFVPAEWFRTRGTVTTTVGKHFDDAVWLHLRLSQVSLDWPGKSEILSLLKARIHTLAEDLYGDGVLCRSRRGPYTTADWQDQWRLRAFCPDALIRFAEHGYPAVNLDPIWRANIRSMEGLFREGLIQNEPVMPRGQGGTGSPESRMRSRLKECLEPMRYRLFSKSFREKAGKPMVLNYDPQCRAAVPPTDVIGVAEVEALHIAQDHCLGHYTRREIAFEACPTSNLIISQLAGYDDHPLFRWSPPDERELAPKAKHNPHGLRCGRLPVCIATDDPGIFCTTLAGEYAHLAVAATECLGVNPDTVQQWSSLLKREGAQLLMRDRR